MSSEEFEKRRNCVLDSKMLFDSRAPGATVPRPQFGVPDQGLERLRPARLYRRAPLTIPFRRARPIREFRQAESKPPDAQPPSLR